MTDSQQSDDCWPVQRLGRAYGAEEIVDAVLGLKTKVAQLYQNFRSLLGTAAEFQTANEGTSSWRNVSRRMKVLVSPGLVLCCANFGHSSRSWRLLAAHALVWPSMPLPGTLPGVHPSRRARCSSPDKDFCSMQPLSLSPVKGHSQSK